MRLSRTPPGAWLLGPGLPLLSIVGALVLMLVLTRRRAPLWAYLVLAAAGFTYAFTFSALRAARLERTHLPEYGLVALLSWRALTPLVPGTASGYAAAAVLGTLIGYGDELIQGLLPNRVYDLRDVGMNAVGAVLGIVVLAASRAGVPRTSSEVSIVPTDPVAETVTKQATSRSALKS